MNTGMRTLPGKIFWTVLIAGLAWLCVAAASHKRNMPIKGIAVHLTDEADNTAFMRSADIERKITEIIGPLANHKVGDISCDIIEETLQKIPFVRQADVYVSGNAILTVRITQRHPVLRVMSQGKSFYIDDEGQQMPVSPHYTARVHVLTGTHALDAAPEILTLIQHLRKDKLLGALIEQLHIDAKDDLILIPKTGQTRIYFGRTDRIAEKCENLKAFYHEIVAQTDWSRYGIIDLRYRDQIICKKNPTS